MAAPRSVYVIEDPRYLEHRGPDGHPERPERLRAVGEAIAAHADRTLRIAPRPAEPEEILRVHGREHWEALARLEGRAARIDADTFASEASIPVARLAAGGAIDLALRVATGDVRVGLAAIRPPGHHAEAGRAMGFCLLNNAAAAVRAVQAEGVGRVMVLDWDVHHGNGTQHIFEHDPSVLYVSTHQYPYYPGTGAAHDVGLGEGLGSTLNVPMPAGCGDVEYVGALLRLVVPAARSFRPELILVSCGFDAHADDPLASMEVSARGYAAMTAVVRALADDVCDGRIAVLLEGGYSLLGLREGVDALLTGLLADAVVLPDTPDLDPGTMLRGVVERVCEVQQRFHPALGAP